MLKKGFSMLAAAILALPLFRVSVSAAPDAALPFTLTAPEHVAITYLNGNDSLNTCQIVWSQNASMSEWASRVSDPATHEETVTELAALGYDDLSYTAQMDWSIDSTEDWHYNAYWDTDGYDSNYVQHLGDWAYTDFLQGDDISTEAWVFRDMGNIADTGDAAWYGRHEDGDDYTGWKDVLKEGQYRIVDTDDGGQHAQLDFANHTVNVRMRWLVTVHKAGELAEGDSGEIRIGSDWSPVAAVGKDAAPVVSVKAGDLAAPVIRDLHYTDEEFNTYPVVAFSLDVPDSVTNTLINTQAAGGGISLHTEARVAGGEWVELQGDWTLKSGEIKIKLQMLAEQQQNVAKDTPIELRCRYDCTPNSDAELFYTEYSNVLTVAAEAMQVTTAQPPQETENAGMTSNSALTTAPAGNHEAPSGIGWLWIILIAIAAIVLLLIIVMMLNKRKEDGGKK